MILYLTSNANVNLLDFVESELELPVKKLTGQFSLLSFVVKDMRHFSHVRYVAIDRHAVLESDEEMVQALLSFQTMYDMRVIVIAEGLPKSSPFMRQLVQARITNVVTASDIESIQQEIQECFSEEGMTKHKKAASATILDELLIPDHPRTNERYVFDCTNVVIAIAGSDRRTGVTTTAINFVCWINSRGGTACYLEANTSKHLAHIVHLFQPEQNGHAYVIEGQDFYFTRELNRDYNFIVVDCGVIGDKNLQEAFLDADVRVLCGSAMPYELPMFYRAMERCKDLSVWALGLFVADDMKPFLERAVSKNMLFGESSHELFDSEVNFQVYKQLLGVYMTTLL